MADDALHPCWWCCVTTGRAGLCTVLLPQRRSNLRLESVCLVLGIMVVAAATPLPCRPVSARARRAGPGRATTTHHHISRLPPHHTAQAFSPHPTPPPPTTTHNHSSNLAWGRQTPAAAAPHFPLSRLARVPGDYSF